MAVVSLAAEREARQPHWEGTAYCVGCKHEWQAVAPMAILNIECPSCGCMKGVPKFPFGSMPGDLTLVCNCGCEALTAYKRAGKFYVKCMGCGTDQTETFYD